VQVYRYIFKLLYFIKMKQLTKDEMKQIKGGTDPSVCISCWYGPLCGPTKQCERGKSDKELICNGRSIGC